MIRDNLEYLEKLFWVVKLNLSIFCKIQTGNSYDNSSYKDIQRRHAFNFKKTDVQVQLVIKQESHANDYGQIANNFNDTLHGD